MDGFTRPLVAKVQVSSMWCLTVKPSESVERWAAINRHRYFIASVVRKEGGYQLSRVVACGTRCNMYAALGSVLARPEVEIVALGCVWHDSGELSMTVRAEDCDKLKQPVCDVIHGLSPDIREAYSNLIDSVMRDKSPDQEILPFPGIN